ncbi:unnamed protein product [Rhodiola kirilowii]
MMKNGSLCVETLLHGNLDLQIIEARSLPNMDLLTEHVRRFFHRLRLLRSFQ